MKRATGRSAGASGAAEPGSVGLRGAWLSLRDRLSGVLGVLEERQYLVLSTRRSPYYVQFAMEEDSCLLAEAVSDSFLPKGLRLGKARKEALLGLGWQAPSDGSRKTRTRQGRPESPNFHRRFKGRDEFEVAASIAVRALRDVYGFPRPGALRYNSFEREGGQILLPTLGLGRYVPASEEAPADTPESLRDQVLETVRDAFGLEEVRFNSKGMLALEVDDALVFVQVLGEPQFVRLYAPVLLEVANEERALAFLNTLNLDGIHSRFLLYEGSVIAVIDQLGVPFVPDHFVESFMSIAASVQALPKRLKKAIGGRMPSEPKATRAGAPGKKGPRRR